jgi:hypothetical protein
MYVPRCDQCRRFIVAPVATGVTLVHPESQTVLNFCSWDCACDYAKMRAFDEVQTHAAEEGALQHNVHRQLQLT